MLSLKLNSIQKNARKSHYPEVTRVLTVKLFFNWNKDLHELCTGQVKINWFCSLFVTQCKYLSLLNSRCTATMINISI